MRTGSRSGTVIRQDQGAVMVFFAVVLPVLILFCGFVVDIANWYEHRRHLQTQADAAALAAAGDWKISGCNDATIQSRAREYGGWSYNKQVGGTSPDDVEMALNSATWPFDQSSPTDPDPPAGSPCETGIIDVKLTERGLDWFFGLGDVDFINVKARVRIEGVGDFSGPNLLPVSVDHVDPKAARVWFVDENTGEVLESRSLTKVTVDSSTEMAIWDNATSPVSLAVNRDDIGVRVALSGDPNTTTCGAPLVECYDLTDQNRGLVYIRRWTQGGTVNAGEQPKARNVELKPGTCNDAYFYSGLKDCSIGMVADVEFAPDVDPTGSSPQARLIAGVGLKDYELSYNDVDDPANPFWELASGGIPLDPNNGGPMPVELRWVQTAGKVGDTECTATTACKGTFGDVQRAYIADPDRSGPIQLLQIEEDGQLFANSLEDLSDCASTGTADCTHDLIVRLGVEGNLEATTDRDDPPRILKLSDSGSQTRGLDCNYQPGADDFQDEVQFGCPPEIVFTPNTGTECPKMTSANYFAAYAPPYECVGNQPGNWRQKLVRGMNLRVYGTEEPTLLDCETNPNNWRTAPNALNGLPDLDPSDPRILTLFITPFGSADDEGRETEPILSFAAFYATGWAGQGNSTPVPCTDQDKPDGKVRGGYLMGYFFKYTTPLNSGGGSGESCDSDLSSLSPCVAVLVE